MKKFALIGVSGYIAPRHLKAISDTNNDLLAAFDKFDSAGILDSYFPDADFFKEIEQFDRHLDALRRKGTPVDYVSICSPNYLHDSHARFALRNNADAIVEQPLALNPWDLEALEELENETGNRVYNILQLRLHPAIAALREKIKSGDENTIHDVDLTFLTSRGNWYFSSWKGEKEKSGGVATHIGISFFDMLTWIFGRVQENIVHISQPDRAAGLLYLERARVRWMLSVNYDAIPDELKKQNKRSYRSITVDGTEIEFSEGFGDLHTRSYDEILRGNGFGIADAMPSVQLAHDIRFAKPEGKKGEYHPFLDK